MRSTLRSYYYKMCSYYWTSLTLRKCAPNLSVCASIMRSHEIAHCC